MKEVARLPFGIERFHEACVSITPHFVQLFGTTAGGERVIVEFSPYQGVKITTEDCFPSNPPFTWIVNADNLVEVTNSAWLTEMKRALGENDQTADFLDQSKHFVLPTPDAVIEIIAWEWTIKRTKVKRG